MKKRITKKDEKDEFEKEYVAEILEDFRSRQIDRKAYETRWQMNINFYIGNQHCVIDGKGDVVDNLKQYLWEEFRRNNIPKFYKYFNEWIENLTESQIMFYGAYAEGKKTIDPMDKFMNYTEE